jgi:hypothetical protein
MVGGGDFWQSPAPAHLQKGQKAMSESQSAYLKQTVRNLARVGIPFDLAAVLVAAQMKKAGIPITEANLDAAFA